MNWILYLAVGIVFSSALLSALQGKKFDEFSTGAKFLGMLFLSFAWPVFIVVCAYIALLSYLEWKRKQAP